jgi:HNH endonuclease
MSFGPLTCQYCGKTYMVNARKRVDTSRFCSRSCRGSGPNPKKANLGAKHPKYVPVGTRRNWKGVPGVQVKTDQGWEREHRVVAQPGPDQVVHHVNGDPTDNRPENLEIMTQAEHAKLHDPERERDMLGRFT